MDFVLWKPSDADLPGWDSPWGRGRPGWHIECSAMSEELLGQSFDIHGGGIDLQFPHHENEIAQSICAHPESSFAKVWMHNEMLQVEGKKMSKSLGNFFTVRDLLDKGIPGEVIRFVFLQTHYSKPMDWTEEKARQARETLWKWRKLTDDVDPAPSPTSSVLAALADDLNTAGAIAALHELAEAIRNVGNSDVPNARNILNVPDGLLKFADHLAPGDVNTGLRRLLKASAHQLGLLQSDAGEWATSDMPDLSTLADRLVRLRTNALATKDFSKVDALRTWLNDAGVAVQISKAGVELIPGPNFDPAKLESLK